MKPRRRYKPRRWSGPGRGTWTTTQFIKFYMTNLWESMSLRRELDALVIDEVDPINRTITVKRPE